MPKKSRKSAFVPRVLVRTAIASVVPACVLACGDSNESPTPPAPVADAGHDASSFLGVAAVAFQAYDSAAPDVVAPSLDSGATRAKDASTDSGHPIFGVAAVAYRAFDSGASDGNTGASDAEQGGPADATPDVFHGPIPLAIRAYEVEPPKKGT